MFGFYRLILALMVALSHQGLTYHGFNPGQWAVVCFYVLSGFLMERQFRRLAPSGGVQAFYLDRFLRIYPVYFVVTALCAWVSPVSESDLWQNFVLIPVNYSTFTHVPPLVGPAWSLACEVHFYLLIPALAAISTQAIRLLSVLSVAVFAISPWLPASTFWAYTGLPGVLFVFLTGMMISRRDWFMLRILYFVLALLWMFFSSSKFFALSLPTGIHINVCTGYLVALPATWFLSHLSPKVVWDQFLGLFSYPLFLVHMLVLELCYRHGLGPDTGVFVALSLLAAAALVVLIERPFDVLRYRIRKRPSLK